jgi:predicted nuclease of predicted toxin-antitoxin system
VNFVADECVAQDVVTRLRADGHDVYAVREQQKGIDDTTVLETAIRMGRVLLTQDLDFGELVYRQNLPHTGVILIRLTGLAVVLRADRVAELVRTREAELTNAFTVLTPTATRIRPPQIQPPPEDPA